MPAIARNAPVLLRPRRLPHPGSPRRLAWPAWLALSLLLVVAAGARATATTAAPAGGDATPRAATARMPSTVDGDRRPGTAQPRPKAVSRTTATPAAAHGKARFHRGTRLKPKAHAVRGDNEPDAFIYGRRSDVLRFATEAAVQHGLDPNWVEATLAQARFVPTVVKLIMPPPPGTAKNWAAYRARFVEPDRIRAGVAFWRENQAWLDAAQERYGVPPEIVVGILGVETYYGRLTGGFRVLDALATLSFDFPAGRRDRSGFFRDELAQFLALAQRDSLDATRVKGSFAGAIGLGQFMPGSILRHAVDFDGDGRIDMLASAADVIGSIAHYLAEAGWQSGMATHFDVSPPVDSADRAALLLPDIVPTFSAAQMAERGAVLDAVGRQHEGLLALVELQNGDAAPSYLAGTHNFFVVTRYNNSSYYARAVIELGRIVDAVRRATP